MNQAQDKEVQKQLSDSLKIESQWILAENGGNFILWGVLVIISWVLTYIVNEYEIAEHLGWLYVVLYGSGWGYMIYSSKKEAKREKSNPLTIRMTAAIWLSVLGTASLVALFGSISKTIDLDHLGAIIFSMLGIAYFMQGVMVDKKWVRNLAFGWWGGSVLLYFVTGLWAGILSSLMMVGLQIIPGIIFVLQWKPQLLSAKD